MSLLLGLFLIVSCVRSSMVYILEGTKSFTLDATNVNPQIVVYQKAGIPYSSHWKTYATPYEKDPFPISSLSEEINTLDFSGLRNGEYQFLLYTINLRDFSTQTVLYNITIHAEHSDLLDVSALETISMVFEGLLILEYQFIKVTYNLMRAALISLQYVHDHVLSLSYIESSKNQRLWTHLDISTAHYMTTDIKGLSLSEFRQRYTLQDYFIRNNAPLYEVAKYAFTIINDFTTVKFGL